MNTGLTVRERTEEMERAYLSGWATLSAETKGRDRFEEPDPLRSTFQQDRDRILHSAAFRRLKGKTQALTAPTPSRETQRDWLTHTLEVAAIARTAARGLRLNEDLVEAIALGHDLGHPPFGAAGEQALSGIAGAFRHAEQSLRVTEQLESAGRGLNLTWEVRDGIVNHTPQMPAPATPEGQLVRLCDRLAGVEFVLDDAVRAGLVPLDDLPEEVRQVLGGTRTDRLNTAIADLITHSSDRPEPAMSPAVSRAHEQLAAFVAERVERRAEADHWHQRAVHCLRSLAIFYLESPDALPQPSLAATAGAGQGAAADAARVLDHVSAMTDQEALEDFARRFLPA